MYSPMAARAFVLVSRGLEELDRVLLVKDVGESSGSRGWTTSDAGAVGALAVEEVEGRGVGGVGSLANRSESHQKDIAVDGVGVLGRTSLSSILLPYPSKARKNLVGLPAGYSILERIAEGHPQGLVLDHVLVDEAEVLLEPGSLSVLEKHAMEERPVVVLENEANPLQVVGELGRLLHRTPDVAGESLRGEAEGAKSLWTC
jgi:hypothetical protein